MESALIECPREFSRNQSAVNYRGRLRKQRLASEIFKTVISKLSHSLSRLSRLHLEVGNIWALKKKKNFLPRTSDKGAISSKLGSIHAVRENPRWKKGREEKVAPYYL